MEEENNFNEDGCISFINVKSSVLNLILILFLMTNIGNILFFNDLFLEEFLS